MEYDRYSISNKKLLIYRKNKLLKVFDLDAVIDNSLCTAGYKMVKK